MAIGANGLDPEESPTSNAATPQDDSAPTQPDASGEPTTPVDDATTPSPAVEETAPERVDPRPRDDLGRFAPKGDESPLDPVVDAIAKLAKPAAEKPPAKTKEAITPEPAAKQAPSGQAPKAEPDTKPLKSSTLVDDLDVPAEEKARWKPHTAARFDKVLSTLRSEREARQADEPILAHGREFSSLVNDFNLSEDMGFVPKEHIAGLIAVQAAVNRGLVAIQQGRTPAPQDRQAFEIYGKAVDNLRAQFGIASSQAAPTVAPFTGELPPDLADLHEVYGIDEKDVRLLAAIRAGASAPPPQQAPPPQAPPPPALPPPQPQQPQGVDMASLYADRLVGELTREGDAKAADTLASLLNHPATKNEVIRRFPSVTPGQVPDVFNALDPKEKYEILRAASRVAVKQVQPRSPTLPPPTTQRSATSGAPPRRAAPEANGDPVASAIAFMAKD